MSGMFLGIDTGTQSMKGILIDPDSGWTSMPVSVHFGRDLPQYGSPDGFLPDRDPRIRQADPCMWLAALDLLLARMKAAGLPLDEKRRKVFDGNARASSIVGIVISAVSAV